MWARIVAFVVFGPVVFAFASCTLVALHSISHNRTISSPSGANVVFSGVSAIAMHSNSDLWGLSFSGQLYKMSLLTSPGFSVDPVNAWDISQQNPNFQPEGMVLVTAPDQDGDEAVDAVVTGVGVGTSNSGVGTLSSSNLYEETTASLGVGYEVPSTLTPQRPHAFLKSLTSVPVPDMPSTTRNFNPSRLQVVTANDAPFSQDDPKIIRLMQIQTSFAVELPQDELNSKSKQTTREPWTLVRTVAMSSATTPPQQRTELLSELVALDSEGLFGGKFLALQRIVTQGGIDNAQLLFVDTANTHDISACASVGGKGKQCEGVKATRNTMVCDVTALNRAQSLVFDGMVLVSRNNTKARILLVGTNSSSHGVVETVFMLVEAELRGLVSDQSPYPPMLPQRGTDMLQLGDINFIILTDVHSWVNGQPHLNPEAPVPADYGDVRSLIDHAQDMGASSGSDVFVLSNGDILDGTGLSRGDGSRVMEIEMMMPYDALTLGNHELYTDASVDALQSSGLLTHFGRRYLTSNVELIATGEPLGSRFQILSGARSRYKAVVFGFLYHMSGPSSRVRVLQVQDVVVTQWFTDAVMSPEAHFAVVLAHMDMIDPLIFVILRKIRELRGPNFVVLFVTGHSHQRSTARLDRRAFSIEAGHYLDTVGFVALKFDRTSLQVNHLTYRFLEASKDGLSAAVGRAYDNFMTPSGNVLRQQIAQARQDLNLTAQIGCLPVLYSYPTAIFNLYVNYVLPSTLPDLKADEVVFAHSGNLRYELFPGPITIDNIEAVAPFRNQLQYIIWSVNGVPSTHITGSILIALLAAERSLWDLVNLTRTMALRDDPIDPLAPYRVVSDTFRIRQIDERLQTSYNNRAEYSALSNVRIAGTTDLPGNPNTHSVWLTYVQRVWQCGKNSYEPPSMFGSHDREDQGPKSHTKALLIGFGVTFAVLVIATILVQRRKVIAAAAVNTNLESVKAKVQRGRVKYSDLDGKSEEMGESGDI